MMRYLLLAIRLVPKWVITTRLNGCSQKLLNYYLPELNHITTIAVVELNGRLEKQRNQTDHE